MAEHLETGDWSTDLVVHRLFDLFLELDVFSFDVHSV